MQRGAIIGKVTASGKYVLCDQSAIDGSQIPRAIVAEDVDASAGDVTNVLAYIGGQFNQAQVIFGPGWNAANAYMPLRSKHIFLATIQAG